VLALLLVLAAAPPTLPHIHERFTPLPCSKHPVRRVFTLLRDPGGRRAFASGERSWLAYRRSICDAKASKFAGGTLAGVVAASCTARHNHRHLDELTSLAKTLKQP